jgi:hypothetical protein
LPLYFAKQRLQAPKAPFTAMALKCFPTLSSCYFSCFIPMRLAKVAAASLLIALQGATTDVAMFRVFYDVKGQGSIYVTQFFSP